MRIERYGVWIDELDVMAHGMPRGYGVAWHSAWSARMFCMRVPFNRIAGKVRAWYLRWQRPCEDDPIMAAYRHGEEKGFVRGNNHGYEQGLRHAAIVREFMR